jgi:hypothetical protein
VVEHERFHATGLRSLDLRQDVVQVVKRLDPRIDGVRMVARGGGSNDLQSMLIKLFWVEADLIGDDDDPSTSLL